MTKNDMRELQYYLVADSRRYETMDRAEFERGDFLEPVETALDGDWAVHRKGVWLHCQPEGARLPSQGWKIHLSARATDASGVLAAAVAALVPLRVPFKFLLDRAVLGMVNSKSWSRGGAGKFITVYPTDEVQFRTLLEALHQATSAFAGPYILSDRRYKSGVVFYRYGGITLTTRLEASGYRTPVIQAPDGTDVVDARSPFFELPDWIQDVQEAEREDGGGLNGGRYAVEHSLAFSNSGGVYLATDGESGDKVVVKEARPFVNETAPGEDVVALLEKEHRILARLADAGIAPRPVEFFREWEHSFLVQEYLEGYIPLGNWVTRGALSLRPRYTRAEAKEYMREYAEVFANLAAALEKMHARGVVFGDFSANNVMLHPQSLEVRFIDFEGAADPETQAPPRFFTPGFADQGRRGDEPLRVHDDYYAFGANMLYAFVRTGMMTQLKPSIGSDWLAFLTEYLGLPAAVGETISRLMHADAASRPKPASLMSALAAAVEAMPESGPAGPAPVPAEGEGKYERSAKAAAAAIAASVDLDRSDRLFPGSPEVFETNPHGVAFGACGVLKTLAAVSPESLTEEMVEWVERTRFTPEAYPPGLQSGLAGIAWTLLDLGRVARAEQILEAGVGHPLLRESFGLFEGAAGWGLTNLKFWSATGKQVYLERALETGAALIASACEDASGSYWKDGSEFVPLGLGFGASGVALFFAYLAGVSGESRFCDAAARALDYDLDKAVPTGGGLSWRRSTDESLPLYPYLEMGSAGIGIACLRVMRVAGAEQYREKLDGIFVDCDRAYSVFPGRNFGLAGLGEFLLDGWAFLGEQKFLEAARKVAAGVGLFAVEDAAGTAFPGNGLFRVSCDYAAGSAGVASFLHRLATGGRPDFMLDELLEKRGPR